jgi:hypothetical protein
MQTAIVAHRLPGRIRLKIMAMRRDPRFFKQLVTDLSKHPAVQEVHANPDTGSILIRHWADPDELADITRACGLLLDARDHAARATTWRSDHRHRAAEGVSSHPAFSARAAGLSGLALLQLARGRVVGSASEQFWHASYAQQLELPLLTLALVGLGIYQLLRGRWLAPASSLLLYAVAIQQAVVRTQAAATPAFKSAQPPAMDGP